MDGALICDQKRDRLPGVRPFSYRPNSYSRCDLKITRGSSAVRPTPGTRLQIRGGESDVNTREIEGTCCDADE